MDSFDTTKKYLKLAEELKSEEDQRRLKDMVSLIGDKFKDSSLDELKRRDIGNIYNRLLKLSWVVKEVQSELHSALEAFGPALPYIFNSPENHSRDMEPLDDEEVGSGESN
jgi:hypothetical protein